MTTPPSPILDIILSGTGFTVATWWSLQTQDRPLNRRQTLLTVIGLFGGVVLFGFTFLRFGYMNVFAPPSSSFSYGPFWRALPALAAEAITIALFSLTFFRDAL